MAYQVPKMHIDVEIMIQDSDPVTGSISISENQFSYRGKPRLEDFLNENENHFFPFNATDRGYILLNKHKIIYMKSSETDPPDAALRLKSMDVEVVFVNGHELFGKIYTDLPDDSMRASDFLNQKEPFLALYLEDQKVVMNTDQILYVKD